MKNKLNLIQAIIALCLLISCSPRAENKELDKYLIPPKNIISDNYTIIKTDSLRIRVPDDEHCTISKGVIFKDSILYGLYDFDKNLIKKINLITGEYIPIKIKDPFKITVKIDQLYIDSLENIYCTEVFPARIHKIDQKGHIIETYSEIFNNEELINSDLGDYLLLNISSVRGDRVFLTGSLGGVGDYMNSPDTFRHFCYNFKIRKLQSAYCTHHGVLAKINDNDRYWWQYHHPSELIVGDYNYIHYWLDHYIYKYDLTTLKLVSKYPCNGSFAKKFPSPFVVDDNAMNNRSSSRIVESKMMKQIPDNCLYGDLFYHKGLNVFSRFSRSADVMRQLIYNDKFNVIGECKPLAKCDILFATSNGFYAIQNYGDLEQADYIDLYKLEIVKK